MSVTINNEDFGTLCICALRYCHGRKTYMPSEVQEIVGYFLSFLSDNDIKVMLDDCQNQKRLELYGDECDKDDWLKWEQKVKAEYERRQQ